MKRARLDARRVRVVLPASRPPLPSGKVPLLCSAYRRGMEQAVHFMGTREVLFERFEKEFSDLTVQTDGHEALSHLVRALFFAGLHAQIEYLTKRRRIISHSTIKNLTITGACTNHELILAQMRLPGKDNAHLFFLKDPKLLKEWWQRQCAGALAVTRIAHFLLTQGYNVFLPNASEDVHWKIDLIASLSGDSTSLCFQIKSNQDIEWISHRVHRTAPNGKDSEAAHRLFEGVRRFQSHVHGIFIPIELTLSARHFAEGSLEPHGYLGDALRNMLRDAHTDL